MSEGWKEDPRRRRLAFFKRHMKGQEEHPDRAIRAPAGDAGPGLHGEREDETPRASTSSAGDGLPRVIAFGDRRDFETLYLRYRQELLDYIARKYQFDTNTAEDVLEDTFLRYFQRSPNLRVRGDIRNYLMSVAHSVVADQHTGKLPVGGSLPPRYRVP
jgi:hypothetical protein